MSKIYRCLRSGELCPEWKGRTKQSDFPKDWELVEEGNEENTVQSGDVGQPDTNANTSEVEGSVEGSAVAEGTTGGPDTVATVTTPVETITVVTAVPAKPTTKVKPNRAK